MLCVGSQFPDQADTHASAVESLSLNHWLPGKSPHWWHLNPILFRKTVSSWLLELSHLPARSIVSTHDKLTCSLSLSLSPIHAHTHIYTLKSIFPKICLTLLSSFPLDYIFITNTTFLSVCRSFPNLLSLLLVLGSHVVSEDVLSTEKQTLLLLKKSDSQKYGVPWIRFF